MRSMHCRANLCTVIQRDGLARAAQPCDAVMITTPDEPTFTKRLRSYSLSVSFDTLALS